MIVEAAHVTHPGRVRSDNEDAVLVGNRLVARVALTAPEATQTAGLPAWFVVADGMGGEEHGEVASRETLAVLRDGLAAVNRPEEIEPLLGRARARLEAIAAEHRTRLGTTVAGLLLTAGGGIVFNVGDCRVYKLRGGFLNRLTRDHSLLEAAGAAGLPVGPAGVPRNIVTSAVMGGDPEPMQVFVRAVPVKAGDVFLVCCDGLWGALPVEKMEEACRAATPSAIAAALLAAALPVSEDNISAIVVRLG